MFRVSFNLGLVVGMLVVCSGCPSSPTKGEEKPVVRSKTGVRSRVIPEQKSSKRKLSQRKSPKRKPPKRGCPVKKNKAFCKRWKKCEKGAKAICFQMGKQFVRGEKVKKSFPNALDSFALGCKHGHGMSCLHAGMLYANGSIRSKERREWAAFYSRKACDLKIARGCAQIAFYYEVGLGVKKKSIKWSLYFFRKACTLKNANACGHVGMYYTGKRSPKVKANYKKAIQYLTVACKSFDGQGCRTLALLIKEGKGGKKDPERAHQLLLKACKRNDAPSCDLIAQRWIREKKWEEALKTLKKSCQLLSGFGCYQQGLLFEKGQGVEIDRKQANSLHRKACGLNYADACYALAISYKEGRELKKDPKKYVELITKSCRTRGMYGCYELGIATQKGLFGIKKDPKKAASLLRQACLIGYKKACK